MSIHKLKSTAQAIAVPQSKADVQRDIKTLGDAQRELMRIETEINDELAKLTKARVPRIEALRLQITELQSGVQTWCEAHRLEICGKGKSANLITGEVNWRQRPPLGDGAQCRGGDQPAGRAGAHGICARERHSRDHGEYGRGGFRHHAF